MRGDYVPMFIKVYAKLEVLFNTLRNIFKTMRLRFVLKLYTLKKGVKEHEVGTKGPIKSRTEYINIEYLLQLL